MTSGNIPDTYWRALYQFAVSIGADDLVNNEINPTRQISSEDRHLLEEALRQLVTETDPFEHLKTHINILTKLDLCSPTEADHLQAMTSLQQLSDMIENLGSSSDFLAFDGLKLLISLIASPVAEFRSSGAQLVGRLSQNNPDIQIRLFDAKILPLLLEMLVNDVDEDVRTNSLYALSCLVRNNDRGIVEFTKNDGFRSIFRAIRTNQYCNDRFLTKSAFFLSQLAIDSDNKKEMISIGFPDQLAGLLVSMPTDHQSGEYLLATLVLLIDKPSDLTIDHNYLIESLNERPKLSNDPHQKERIEQLTAKLYEQ